MKIRENLLFRRSFLKAAVAFCAAPFGFLLKNPFPESFALEIVQTAEGFNQARFVIGLINAKPYRGYPKGTLMLVNMVAKPGNIEVGDSKLRLFRTRSTFHFRKKTKDFFASNISAYASFDFNRIDFGEEVPA